MLLTNRTQMKFFYLSLKKKFRIKTLINFFLYNLGLIASIKNIKQNIQHILHTVLVQ